MYLKQQSANQLLIRLALWGVMVLALQLSAHSQKTTVYGVVTDAETGETLPFVNISFQNSKVGTTTDLNGAYRLESYYATDSLSASFVGYKRATRAVRRDETQELNFALQPGSVQIDEVVINARDFVNPAHAILKRIIANKPINNREKLDAYQYKTYNKIEFDINNFTSDFTGRRIFKDFEFIFDYIDSSEAKVSLPVFMTESISDYFYRRKPKSKKEIIRATKVSGLNNQSVSQFLGQMYQDVNIYENSILVFDKNFISPLADYGLTFYRYYLTDSAYLNSKWCYKLEFVPRNPAELTFEGHFWVNDTTYAIKEIEATLSESANLNFVSHLWVAHAYEEVEPEVWMLTRESMLCDFNLREDGTGIYGRKTTLYNDFVINEPKSDEFFEGPENIEVVTEVNSLSEDYWTENRPEPLSTSEAKLYQMVDSLKNHPRFVTYVDIINFIFTGYKVYGKVELGPVWSALSWNLVEGYRVRLGGRTSNAFSKRLMLEGYGAYGFGDSRFKYMAGAQYFLSKKPRHSVRVRYSEDLELLGQEFNLLPRDHIFTSIFRRNPQDRLTFVKEFLIGTEREWFTGFSTRLTFTRRNLVAEGNWSYNRPVTDSETGIAVSDITTSEISLQVRYAHQEKFLAGEFDRVSLGSKYPIVTVRFDHGIPTLWGSDYDYNRLSLSITDNLPLGPLGRLEILGEGGKIFNALPYPLLFIHPGNETIFRNSMAFGTMNFFEFVSDEYFRGRLEYHLDGLLFNKIPLFKRLKLREVCGAQIAIGNFNARNTNELILPELTYTLNNQPYVEAFVGVENIFKLLRIDAIWRLNYLDNENVNRLAIQVGYEIQF